MPVVDVSRADMADLSEGHRLCLLRLNIVHEGLPACYALIASTFPFSLRISFLLLPLRLIARLTVHSLLISLPRDICIGRSLYDNLVHVLTFLNDGLFEVSALEVQRI